MLAKVTTILAMPAVAYGLATARPEFERYVDSYERTPLVSRQDTEHALFQRTPAATEMCLQLGASSGVHSKRELLQRLIGQFAATHSGWNGEGSVAPSAVAVNAARTFLESIPPGIALPTPMLTEIGEMEFYWSLPTGYADISFDAEGIGSFFVRDQDGNEFFAESLAPDFRQFPEQERIISVLAPHLLVTAA
ncbi:hypothetical protein E4Q23_19290 [Candidatus Accumulibacter phosphatis]|uniref:Uncharacterized protein n=1 Tax=Candidatus Accumulibacter phosphatis TaxID=327160 RepID=A0ABX1U310_9PROT|nr:hypothetical protein [Candidatus Accumulibacter phosphatis]NMQ29724.1 hypothetical protein [Candidatus Accumulibacter phosphatis]